jgi:hypothetical protein
MVRMKPLAKTQSRGTTNSCPSLLLRQKGGNEAGWAGEEGKDHSRAKSPPQELQLIIGDNNWPDELHEVLLRVLEQRLVNVEARQAHIGLGAHFPVA